jgi:hypothetical protein
LEETQPNIRRIKPADEPVIEDWVVMSDSAHSRLADI